MSHQIRDFIVTILVVTFVFAFDDKQAVFQLGPWIRNFLHVAIGVTLVVLVHYFGHKWAARRYGTDVVHKIWTIKQYGFHAKAHFRVGIPLGSIFAIIVTFLSNGGLFFTAVEAFDIKNYESSRLGRWRLKVLEREVARIAFAGPAFNMIFAFILQAFNTNDRFDTLILISCLYALYHMIPWSQLDGAKIFFGSLYLYVFGLAFLLLSFLLIKLLSPGTAFFLSLAAAVVILVVFFLRMQLPK